MRDVGHLSASDDSRRLLGADGPLPAGPVRPTVDTPDAIQALAAADLALSRLAFALAPGITATSIDPYTVAVEASIACRAAFNRLRASAAPTRLPQSGYRILVEAVNYWLQFTDPDEISEERRDQAARLLDRLTESP